MNAANPGSEENETFGIEQALRRAAHRAREVAARTGTPLVILRDGQIERVRVGPGTEADSGRTGPAEHYGESA
jgi:hypothetical protein